jgi:hypothetical protein
MEADEARRILGVGPTADAEAVRTAYRHLVRRTHPDVSDVPDATSRTVRLTQAYSLLLRPPATQSPPSERATGSSGRAGPGDPGPPVGPPDPVDVVEPVEAALVDGDTIAVGAPRDETLLLVIEAAHALGEIGYLDPSAGLVEVIVEFVEAPTSSVLLSLQGRATGVTDVFCTVEPLSGGAAPPADAVTRLVLATLLEQSV